MLKPLTDIKAFLVDLDGTTYLSQAALPGAVNFFAYLQKKNIPYLFFSNNPARNIEEYITQLTKIGISAQKNNIITSALATIYYLKNEKINKVYAVGTPSFEQELKHAGIKLTADKPEALVIAFDTTLTYKKIRTAALLLHHNPNLPYIATNPDLTCPTSSGPIPDCGALIAMLKSAANRDPLVIGKPNQGMISLAVDRLQIPTTDMALVGDRLYTDIRMAVEQGLTSVLVLSGETKQEELAKTKWQPDYVFQNLEQLLLGMDQ